MVLRKCRWYMIPGGGLHHAIYAEVLPNCDRTLFVFDMNLLKLTTVNNNSLFVRKIKGHWYVVCCQNVLHFQNASYRQKFGNITAFSGLWFDSHFTPTNYLLHIIVADYTYPETYNLAVQSLFFEAVSNVDVRRYIYHR